MPFWFPKSWRCFKRMVFRWTKIRQCCLASCCWWQLGISNWGANPVGDDIFACTKFPRKILPKLHVPCLQIGMLVLILWDFRAIGITRAVENPVGLNRKDRFIMMFLNTVAGAWGVVLLYLTSTYTYIYTNTYYTIYILEIQTPFEKVYICKQNR